MADYAATPWLAEATKLGPTNLNHLEAGVADAAAHHRRGTRAAMPAASALNKNWIYWAYDTGERFISDGAAWQPLPVGTAGLLDGAVTAAKLDAGVTALLPGASEKAALAGEGDSHAAPSAANPFLTKDDRVVLSATASAGTTVTLSFAWNRPEGSIATNGIWLAEAVFGGARIGACLATIIFAVHTNTADGQTKYLRLLAATNQWSYSTTSWGFGSNDTPNATLIFTVNAGLPAQVTVLAERLTGGKYT